MLSEVGLPATVPSVGLTRGAKMLPSEGATLLTKENWKFRPEFSPSHWLAWYPGILRALAQETESSYKGQVFPGPY